MVSLGGALGSLGGSVLAPAVLNGDFELPLILTAVGFAFAWQIRRGPEPVISVVVALVAASAMLGMSVKSIHDQIKGTRLLARNFYASLRVMDTGEDKVRRRQLEHGGIEHGAQFLDPARRHTPLTYYGPRSGIGLAIARQRELAAGRPLSIGVVGLGAGTLAAWGEPEGKVKFYEINPRVLSIANSEFFFLTDAMASKTQVETALGDARLVMEREPPQRFDVLAVDAFSGDAIPMHLLTREAMAIYRRHVAEGGVLAIHISNKFVDARPGGRRSGARCQARRARRRSRRRRGGRRRPERVELGDPAARRGMVGGRRGGRQGKAPVSARRPGRLDRRLQQSGRRRAPTAPRRLAHDPEKCERFSDKIMRRIKTLRMIPKSVSGFRTRSCAKSKT